jgi:hypothetical protein
MSMGVGQALRFKPHVTLEQAIELCWELRPKCRKAQADHLAKQFARVCEAILIQKYRYKHEVKEKPLEAATTAWRQVCSKEDQQRYSWDTRFDIMLYRIECPETHETILLSKSAVGQNHFHTLLARNLPARDYHYQNSTDKPSHISNANWRLRRKHWEEALPGIGVPADNGLLHPFGL